MPLAHAAKAHRVALAGKGGLVFSELQKIPGGIDHDLKPWRVILKAHQHLPGGVLLIHLHVIQRQIAFLEFPLQALAQLVARNGQGATVAVTCAEDAGDQLAWGHRFGEEAGERGVGLAVAIGQDLAAMGGDHDHRGRCALVLPLCPQALGRFQAVHPRHAPVHQHDVVGRLGPLHLVQRLLAADRSVGQPAQAVRRLLQQLPGQRVVIDEAESNELLVGFIDLGQNRATGNGEDSVLGQLPTELFSDFLAIRFRAIAIIFLNFV